MVGDGGGNAEVMIVMMIYKVMLLSLFCRKNEMSETYLSTGEDCSLSNCHIYQPIYLQYVITIVDQYQQHVL